MDSFFKTALTRSGILPDLISERSTNGCQILLGREVLQASARVQELSFDKSLDAKNFAVKYVANHRLVPFTGEALTKPLLRFDFANEWNNLGYGATSFNPEDPFGIPGFFEAKDVDLIAEVIDLRTGDSVSDYAWITKDKSALWFNRNCGPIDGYDWSIVEKFFLENGVPIISEIPVGFDSAFTMRIDCDEAVASGRKLFELYRERGVPFSMAIKTRQELGEEDKRLIREVIEAGGSVVGHSHTHAPDWGGSREATLAEIKDSHAVLRGLGIDGINYDYVVSPFHQNSRVAVSALAEAGIRGFVGGIICNDPEFIFARAGVVPEIAPDAVPVGRPDVAGATTSGAGSGGRPGTAEADSGFSPDARRSSRRIISHSEQCMLHGDCYHQAGNSIEVYKQAYKQARETSTFFGYLDHPFSNYTYGWSSEDERLQAHAEFLDFILGEKARATAAPKPGSRSVAELESRSTASAKIWRASLVDAMRFLDYKSQCRIVRRDGKWYGIAPAIGPLRMSGTGAGDRFQQASFEVEATSRRSPDRNPRGKFDVEAAPAAPTFAGLPQVQVIYRGKSFALRPGEEVLLEI